MYKKCQVAMLATNQKARIRDIVISPRYPNMIQRFGTFENSYENECKVQHLYIISEDVINEGDWFIDIDNSKLWQYDKLNHTIPYLNSKKIIATTDTNIIALYGNDDEMYGKMKEGLPQPSQLFINKYIESYNKGNIITDVMVEYEEYIETTYDSDIDVSIPILILKVSKDNTISIKRIKDTWNRKEVIDIIHNSHKAFMWEDNYSPTQLNKWINNNI